MHDVYGQWAAVGRQGSFLAVMPTCHPAIHPTIRSSYFVLLHICILYFCVLHLYFVAIQSLILPSEGAVLYCLHIFSFWFLCISFFVFLYLCTFIFLHFYPFVLTCHPTIHPPIRSSGLAPGTLLNCREVRLSNQASAFAITSQPPSIPSSLGRGLQRFGAKAKKRRSLFIGPESNHCLLLSLTDSLTNWLTNCCLVHLIDVTMACNDANSKLVEVVTVVDVDDEDRVGNSLLQILKLRNGYKAELLFRLWAKCLVKIL